MSIQSKLFWVYVDVRGPDECWPWTRAKDKDGYGQAWFEGKLRRAHRVAYKLEHPDENIDDLDIHHTCEFEPCCNPEHLEKGTRKEHKAKHAPAYCKRGHEFTSENTYTRPDGRRLCRECQNARMRDYHERRRSRNECA